MTKHSNNRYNRSNSDDEKDDDSSIFHPSIPNFSGLSIVSVYGNLYLDIILNISRIEEIKSKIISKLSDIVIRSSCGDEDEINKRLYNLFMDLVPRLKSKKSKKSKKSMSTSRNTESVKSDKPEDLLTSQSDSYDSYDSYDDHLREIMEIVDEVEDGYLQLYQLFRDHGYDEIESITTLITGIIFHGIFEGGEIYIDGLRKLEGVVENRNFNLIVRVALEVNVIRNLCQSAMKE